MSVATAPPAMSEPISATDRVAYTSAIDSILAGSDLTSISAKKVRQKLQQELDHDFTSQKTALYELIQERFNNFTEAQEKKQAKSEPAPEPKTNGTTVHLESVASKSASPVKHEASSELSDLEDDAPPKKKVKKSKPKDDGDDAAFAARLQAELNNSGRATRGGGKTRPAKATPKKKAPKKKSSSRISAADDSGIEEGSSDEKKTTRGGAFNKPMLLSPQLKDLLGEETLSRPKTVKGIWKHIKEHGLQDPRDKRQILCDEPLKAVFKVDRVSMFKMNKTLSSHLSPIND